MTIRTRSINDESEEQEVKLPRDFGSWWKVLTWVSSLVIAISTATFAVAQDRYSVQNDITTVKVELKQAGIEQEDLKKIIVEQQKQNAILRESVAVMQTDISWIKDRMARSGK